MLRTPGKNRLNLQPTVRLHELLIEQSRAAPDAFRQVGIQIRDAAARHAIRFEGQRELPLALSALVLQESDVDLLRRLTVQLHDLTERAIDWTLAEPERLARFFPEHVWIAPWVARTPGLNSWQGYSRYDAVVTADGSLKFIELNTCCPAGFMHAPDSSEILLDAIKRLKMPLHVDDFAIGTLEHGILIDELLAIEREADHSEEQVALLNDENHLRNEVDLIAAAFRQRGRDVVVANAADLTYDDSAVRVNGRPVSLSWNKIRVSTKNSPNHCWKSGFETRYAAFLKGQRDGALISVNNLVAATIAEDKELLSLMYHPEFRALLNGVEEQFLDDHVLWTARLSSGVVLYRGDEIDLLSYVREHRDQFVIKPANEGRGFGVKVGRYTDPDEWKAACSPSGDLPCIVQQYAEPCTLPVIAPQGAGSQKMAAQEMNLTVAMGVIRGCYRGLFSRIASGPVTNVGQSGMIQAVFTDSSAPGTIGS